MAALFVILVLASSIVAFAAEGSTNLHDKYRFSRMLDSVGQYWLYWSFQEDNISFAVSVQTTGWVGFGLSPNGQMPQSDVVIGWVDAQGQSQFQVSLQLAL